MKAQKGGDFPQIESYGPNTVGHTSYRIPLWEWKSKKLEHIAIFHFHPLGTCAFTFTFHFDLHLVLGNWNLVLLTWYSVLCTVYDTWYLVPGTWHLHTPDTWPGTW